MDVRRAINVALLLAASVICAVRLAGHDVITTKVTFDREIIRLFSAHCTSCHRPEGPAFSLTTYEEARPWAKAIGEEVLRRRMPPWGAVKGFGDFRGDQGLTPEQLELIVDWEEGGAPEGEAKDIPEVKTAALETPFRRPAEGIIASGEIELSRALMLGALWPVEVPGNASFKVLAELPNGVILPLVWIMNYDMKFNHPFILREPLELPKGTRIRGVPRGAAVSLISAADVPPPPKPERSAAMK